MLVSTTAAGLTGYNVHLERASREPIGRLLSARIRQPFRMWRRSAQQRCFGLDVLDGLISGINEFRDALDGRYGSRSLGLAMIGALLWVDDLQLPDRIAQFPAACTAAAAGKAVASVEGHGRI